MEKIIPFLILLAMVIGLTLFFKKNTSYSYRIRKIREELEEGTRYWYLVSVQNGIYAVLPLSNPNSIEFGKLDNDKVLLSQETLLCLLRNDEDKIINISFVREILEYEKYEPATR